MIIVSFSCTQINVEDFEYTLITLPQFKSIQKDPYLFFIKVLLIDNLMLVSDVQYSDLIIYITRCLPKLNFKKHSAFIRCPDLLFIPQCKYPAILGLRFGHSIICSLFFGQGTLIVVTPQLFKTPSRHSLNFESSDFVLMKLFLTLVKPDSHSAM